MTFQLPVNQDVVLQLVSTERATEAFELIDRNREHIGSWLPWVENTVGPDDMVAFAAQCTESYNAGQSCDMYILYGGKLVGSVSWRRIQNHRPIPGIDFGEADIGYWLDGEMTGQGIVTRSVRAVVDHLFSDHEFFRVCIRCEPENVGSNAVPQRLGFAHEGTLRHICKWGDRWVNHHIYSMLKEEWERGE